MHLRDLFPDINSDVFRGFGDNPFSKSTINKQMTKEEILDKRIASTHGNPDYSLIKPAMDEYAKQQAISFMEWFDQTHRQTLAPPGFVEKYYNQFIEQQNKP